MAIGEFPPLMPSAAMRWAVVSSLLPKRIDSALEIGCGQGAVAARLAARTKRLVAIEPDPTSCAVAQKRVGNNATVLNIASNELLPTETFDIVCAFEVIEHVEDDKTTLEEWVSRLNSGGQLLLSTPAHRSRFGAADELAGHFRRYETSEMKQLLESAGLTDVVVTLYGFGAGHILEKARNILARRVLDRGARTVAIDERTAGSGRMFQPRSRLQSIGLTALGALCVSFQRGFPGRGVGLVASARKPL